MANLDEYGGQVDRFLNSSKPRSVNDVLQNTLDSISTPTQYNDNTTQQPNADGRLEVVDGDTIRDNLTGQVTRFQGFDTAESYESDKSKKLTDQFGYKLREQKDLGNKGSEELQKLLDSGYITPDDLTTNAVGVDIYGRTLANVPDATYNMVAKGLAAPTDKLDGTAQDLYRKAQLKNIDDKGFNNSLLADMRDTNVDAQDRDVGRYVGDLGKSIGSSFYRTGAEVMDVILDSEVWWGDGNSEYFDEAKKAENANKAFNLDSRNSAFTKEEVYYKYQQGDYAGAYLTALTAAPEVLAESSGEMALLMTGFGSAVKGIQAASYATKALQGMKTVAKANAGLITHTLAKSNTLLEERALNNKDGELSIGEIAGVTAMTLLGDSLDKLSFGKLLQSKKSLSDIGNTLSSEQKRDYAMLALGGVWGFASKSVMEGGQEILQETADIISKEYGTDKYKDYSSLTREENLKTLITAGILGAGSGGGMSIVSPATQSLFNLGSTAKEHMATKLSKLHTSELYSSMSPEQVTQMKEFHGVLKEQIDAHQTKGKEAIIELSQSFDENGILDYNSLKSDSAKEMAKSSINSLTADKFLDNVVRDEYNAKYKSLLTEAVKASMSGGIKDPEVFSILHDLVTSTVVDMETKNKVSQDLQHMHTTHRDMQSLSETLDELGADDKVKAEKLINEQATINEQMLKGMYSVSLQGLSTIDGISSMSTMLYTKNHKDALLHTQDEVTQNLTTHAKAYKQLLNNGIQKMKALDVLLNSDNVSSLPNSLTRLTSEQLADRANEIRERMNTYLADDSRYTGLSEDSVNHVDNKNKLDEATLSHIEKILINRDKISEKYEVDINPNNRESNQFNNMSDKVKQTLMDFINGINRGEAIQGGVQVVDGLIGSILKSNVTGEQQDNNLLTDTIKAALQHSHFQNREDVLDALEKLQLNDTATFTDEVAKKFNTTINPNEEAKLRVFDVDNVFEFATSMNPTATLSKEDVRLLAKKLGLIDLIC